MVNEKERCEDISRIYKLPVESVRYYRKVPLDKAIEMFLSEEDKLRIVEDGVYNPNANSSRERFRNGMNDLAGKFEPYFNSTTKGREWYISTHLTQPLLDLIVVRIHAETAEYARKLALGQQRALDELRDKRFKG